ncbi:MAG: hypothetical protein K5790_02530 [Nitrosopumilus sp.]|uniref:hypothetical protein n=1 Tax=Nitrosopumilus sp. TaxID=2024843 RepID=UPI00247DF69E|nr:hypothetical protein [Nitrosopumilus sp.]MCV0392152.1 hypothetical protein [Nitrosopumilus sp.]
MNNLPEKFPEYSIMHKTLSKKIKELKEKESKCEKSDLESIQFKIKKYQSEVNKIEKMFPVDFFENYE